MTSGRNYLRQIKANSKCVCGESRNALLEFSHFDRASKFKKEGKSVDISSMKSLDQIKEELKKGRYLCVFCHRDKTIQENQKISENKVQSMINKCIKKKGKGICCHGILCNGALQPRKSFGPSKRRCISCSYLEKKKIREDNKRRSDRFKCDVGQCEYCKEKCTHQNSHRFEWDHIFGKNNNVSKLVNSNINILTNEIKLCRLLCAKCHRLKSILESKKKWNNDPTSFSLIL